MSGDSFIDVCRLAGTILMSLYVIVRVLQVMIRCCVGTSARRENQPYAQLTREQSRTAVGEDSPESEIPAEVRMQSQEHRAKTVAVENAEAQLAFAIQAFRKSKDGVVAATADLKGVAGTRGKEMGATATNTISTTNASAGGREEAVTEANERLRTANRAESHCRKMVAMAAARLKSAREAEGMTSQGTRPVQRTDGGGHGDGGCDGEESKITEGSGSMTSSAGNAASPTETPGGGDIEMGRCLL